MYSVQEGESREWTDFENTLTATGMSADSLIVVGGAGKGSVSRGFNSVQGVPMACTSWIR